MHLQTFGRAIRGAFNISTCSVVRRIHLIGIAPAKKYIDHENTHAHNIMRNSLKAYQLSPLLELNHSENDRITKDILTVYDEKKAGPSSRPIDEILIDLKAIICYCREKDTQFSDKRFSSFAKEFCLAIPRMSDAQLMETLQLWNLLPLEDTVRADNFIDVWNNLDLECCRRIDNWNVDRLLLICDAWYNLRLARICDFVPEALYKLGRKVVKMSPTQLVQTMFLCNVTRRSTFSTIDFETNLIKTAKEMTIDELGVMSMGFFKTQTPIHNGEFLVHLYQRLTEELNTVSDITFVAIIKVLRYSSRLAQVDLMKQLLEDIYSNGKVHTISILGCLHVALMGCELQQSHDALVELVLKRFELEIENTRLKDLERICLAMSIFNIKTESGIEKRVALKIHDSLKNRIEEILQYPRTFTNCLHYLNLVGVHDEEMLAAVLDRKFLKHATGSKLAMCREIFHLDTFTRVNLRDYKGPQLRDKDRQIMGKMLTHYIPNRSLKYKLSLTDSILLSIKDTLSLITPFNSLKHVLPNYERADIVFCYDQKQRKSLPLPGDCPPDYTGAILTSDLLLKDYSNDDVVTVVVVVGGWNNVVRDKDRNTGLMDMKLQQLKLLGHKYIVIYWHEWRALEDHQDRLQFLQRKLSTVIRL